MYFTALNAHLRNNAMCHIYEIFGTMTSRRFEHLNAQAYRRRVNKPEIKTSYGIEESINRCRNKMLIDELCALTSSFRGIINDNAGDSRNT